MNKKSRTSVHPDYLLTNVSDPPDVYVAMEPQVVSEEAEYGQVTLRCELASGHPAILTNVTWYKVRHSFIINRALHNI